MWLIPSWDVGTSVYVAPRPKLRRLVNEARHSMESFSWLKIAAMSTWHFQAVGPGLSTGLTNTRYREAYVLSHETGNRVGRLQQTGTCQTHAMSLFKIE